jgi:RNA polymerase sigma-70 factor (ECF subfamily)
VFVLREVFGMSHGEVADALDRSPASVRQMAHRAREHVQARRPRFESDLAEQRRVTEEFLAACASGDKDTLLALLAPDVTLVSDSDGRAKAARRPILGADKVARFMIGIAGDALALQLRFALVNGSVGIVASDGSTAHSVSLLDIVDGKIASVYIVANPEKLAHVSVS